MLDNWITDLTNYSPKKEGTGQSIVQDLIYLRVVKYGYQIIMIL
jgi:hypothetical protein